jgi:hypothetical protein
MGMPSAFFRFLLLFLLAIVASEELIIGKVIQIVPQVARAWMRQMA